MYKVVIVDDEEIIVRGLQSVVNWNSYKCEVVADSFDGISSYCGSNLSAGYFDYGYQNAEQRRLDNAGGT